MLARAYQVQRELKLLDEKRAELVAEGDRLVSTLVAGNITEAGGYELMMKPRIIRTVNVERFKDRFPEQYEYIRNMEIQKAKMNAGKTILLKEAEGLLGKDVIAPVCDLKTTLTHKVHKQFLDGTEGER